MHAGLFVFLFSGGIAQQSIPCQQVFMQSAKNSQTTWANVECTEISLLIQQWIKALFDFSRKQNVHSIDISAVMLFFTKYTIEIWIGCYLYLEVFIFGRRLIYHVFTQAFMCSKKWTMANILSIKIIHESVSYCFYLLAFQCDNENDDSSMGKEIPCLQSGVIKQ